MKRLLPLYIVIFIGFLTYSIQIPILTSLLFSPQFGSAHFYFAPQKGGKILLGCLLSMYPLGQFFGAPILGALSDRVGRKKVLIASLILSTIMTALCGLSIIFGHIPLLLFFLFLAGLCEGNIAIAQGAIVDVVDDEERSRYFGYIYVSSSLGFLLGPVVASLFSNPEIFHLFGPPTSFWLMSLLMIGLIFGVGKHFTETHSGREKVVRSFFQEIVNISNIFRDPLKYFYGVNFLIYLSLFGFLRIYPTYVTLKYNVSFGMLALIIAYVSLPFIVVNLILTPLFSKLKAQKDLTMISSFLMGLAMISVVVFQSFDSIWITLAATTFCLAFANTFSAAMISFLVSKENQGAAMGNNQSLVALAQGISALTGGFIAMLAIYLPLVFFGLLGILAALLLLKRKHTEWQRDDNADHKPVRFDDNSHKKK